MHQIIVFASGSGTNAENLIKHFSSNPLAKVAAVFCNRPDAGVIPKAEALEVPVFVFSKAMLQDGTVFDEVKKYHPDLIVLAGFLLKFPDEIIRNYPDKIINIHPALLPKYGGKGMYGMHVHRAVYDNKETETGISVHYVNEHYDEGGLIFQQKVIVGDCASADEIAARIHELEQEYFPKVIEQVLNLKS
ncbi:phosphoribosylglycinamide formyltransferase [Flavobacterium pallidum]|uniref:phosphoribosylglycinamide formyltransferase 1 n=1 Tax=Flavobacterium pallidum TaxID=2172098 RepID=A0A2S1SEY9_9FLAO|nr:phosphoribosylglycinamide formyltransferase [Flavobacterium pallidum]AWI24976.1 phosphoribosylglycinamide formyltransferase [Flavobacterium pallidum]